jgi:hypothetical protein
MNEVISIVTDPAHLTAEALFVAFELAVARPIFKVWLRHHDRTVHGTDGSHR